MAEEKKEKQAEELLKLYQILLYDNTQDEATKVTANLLPVQIASVLAQGFSPP